MPDLELGPNDYRKRDPKSGQWQIPDDPKLARLVFFIILGILAFIFWKRDELSAGTLFGVAAMFAFCGGVLFKTWLRDRY